MYVLSIISFLLWAGFLLLAAMRFGIPDMMSDVYYQLQKCTGSEVIGDKRKRNYGWAPRRNVSRETSSDAAFSGK